MIASSFYTLIISGTKVKKGRYLKNTKRFFSLVELLIVIGIITLLLGLVGSAIGGLGEMSDNLGCQNNLSTLHKAFTNYYEKQGHFVAVNPIGSSGTAKNFHDSIGKFSDRDFIEELEGNYVSDIGYFPNATNHDDRLSTDFGTYPILLNNYYDNMDWPNYFVCPNDPAGVSGPNGLDDTQAEAYRLYDFFKANLSYRYNPLIQFRHELMNTPASIIDPLRLPVFWDHYMSGRPRSIVKGVADHADDNVFLFDAIKTEYGSMVRHYNSESGKKNDLSNMVFYDGHIEQISKEENDRIYGDKSLYDAYHVSKLGGSPTTSSYRHFDANAFPGRYSLDFNEFTFYGYITKEHLKSRMTSALMAAPIHLTLYLDRGGQIYSGIIE